MGNIKALIFDMDGTILNTLEDLADTTNYALQMHGMPTHSMDEIRMYVGNGIGKLIERAVPAGTDQDTTKKVLDTFKEYYKDHCAIKTRPYDGILELLETLRSMGYLTAVVSNKADFAVQSLCKDYFDGLFDASVGEKEGIRRKPAPDSVFDVLQQLSIQPKEAIYIGDSDVDMETAANAQMEAIAVLWGFRDKEFLLAHGATRFAKIPKDILTYLDEI